MPPTNSPTNIQAAKNIPKRNYALVATSKPAQAPENSWTQVVYRNQKQHATNPNAKRLEPAQKKILFPREEVQLKKQEEDIMLALNEAFQKSGEPTSV